MPDRTNADGDWLINADVTVNACALRFPGGNPLSTHSVLDYSRRQPIVRSRLLLWITVEMPKCRGKKETTKRVNNTGRRSRASQLQAARGNRRKATFAAVDLEAVTGDLPRSQPGSVSVTDRHGAGGSALNVTASSSKRKFDMMCAASSAYSDDVDVTSDHRDSLLAKFI